MKFKGNQLRKFKREETLQKIFLFCMDLYILTKFFYNKHVPYNKEKVRAVLEKNPLLQKQISYCLKSTPLTHYTRPRMVWPGRDSLFCQPRAHSTLYCKQHSGTFHQGITAPHPWGQAHPQSRQSAPSSPLAIPIVQRQKHDRSKSNQF